jgi:hypothetical protein
MERPCKIRLKEDSRRKREDSWQNRVKRRQKTEKRGL